MTEFEDVREQSRGKKVKVSFKDMITGSAQLREVLATNIWFIIFVAFLGFLYIHNQYAIEREMKQYRALSEQVKNLKAEATITGAEVMSLSSRTSVRREVERRGLDLKEPTSPPILLK